MGLRKTVKLSPRPRPSTDRAKQSASTLSATRAGFNGVVAGFSRAFWSMALTERFSGRRSRGLERMCLCRLEQHVTLPAERQLDDAFRREVLQVQDRLLVGDGGIVEAKAAALDLTPRLAVRRNQAHLDERRKYADA